MLFQITKTAKGKRELNVQADVKTKNSKRLKVKALVDSRCTHTEIDKTVWSKERKIQTRPINFSFEIFNVDRTKNREVTKVAISRS